MASFYPNLSGEEDMLPPTYLLNHKPGSYQPPELDNNKVYSASQPSVSLSYSNLLSGGGSMSVHEPGNTDTSMLSKGLVHSTASGLNQQYHGLSLTLGSNDPPLAQLHSDLNLNQYDDLKNIHYLSFDLAGQAQDAVKFEAGNTFQSLHQGSEYAAAAAAAATLCNSRYVKAGQDLLNELVCVHTPPKLQEKIHNFNQNGSRESISTAEPQESTNNDLSTSQRLDTQNKVSKLLGMLDELDRRYKQYCHQMQVVVSSFDMMAGCGAAQPYTALALQTISRQFRCLRDAIKKQIQAIQKSLGEQDVGPNGVGVLSRLRYVDQQLRQQKALQQFGVMRQPWRPQRGLPETAVSVLRAWLFEHFLHPYPKDSEKLVLARQTGLTRNQVANWFINARVRLWKPMIEEMYKEEFGDTETELKSSPNHAMPARETSVFDDRDEEFQGSLVSAVTDGNHHVQSRAEFSQETGAFQGNEVNFGLMHMQLSNQTINMAGNSLFTHDHTPLNTSADGASRDQVSLALGLQQDEKALKPTPDEMPLKGNEGSPSSMALEKLEYYYADPVNNQHRFANTHLLSDFVA